MPLLASSSVSDAPNCIITDRNCWHQLRHRLRLRQSTFIVQSSLKIVTYGQDILIVQIWGRHDIQYYDTQYNGLITRLDCNIQQRIECHYAECRICLLCWTSLCWVSWRLNQGTLKWRERCSKPFLLFNNLCYETSFRVTTSFWK